MVEKKWRIAYRGVDEAIWAGAVIDFAENTYARGNHRDSGFKWWIRDFRNGVNSGRGERASIHESFFVSRRDLVYSRFVYRHYRDPTFSFVSIFPGNYSRIFVYFLRRVVDESSMNDRRIWNAFKRVLVYIYIIIRKELISPKIWLWIIFPLYVDIYVYIYLCIDYDF